MLNLLASKLNLLTSIHMTMTVHLASPRSGRRGFPMRGGRGGFRAMNRGGFRPGRARGGPGPAGEITESGETRRREFDRQSGSEITYAYTNHTQSSCTPAAGCCVHLMFLY